MQDTLIGVGVNNRRTGMNFAVYSKEGCSYCKQIKQVFDAKGISYREYILDHHFSREAFYGEFGDLTTFPQVLLNADKLGGCVETVKYLRENNII